MQEVLRVFLCLDFPHSDSPWPWDAPHSTCPQSWLTGKGQQPLECPGMEQCWEPLGIFPFVALLCLGLHTDGVCPQHHPALLPPAPGPRGLPGRTGQRDILWRTVGDLTAGWPSPTLPSTPGARWALAFLGLSGAPLVS